MALQGSNIPAHFEGVVKMSAERWIKELEMIRKVRQHVRAKEKVQAAEEEKIRQEAEKQAWIREFGLEDEASCRLKGGGENEI